jgi:hypothetical protein
LLAAPPQDLENDHLDALELYLRGADQMSVSVQLLDGGWQHKALILLEGGVEAIQKPAAGSNGPADEGPVAVQREAAAWGLARLLGWADLIAATISDEMFCPKLGTRGLASLQVAWPDGFEWVPDLGTLRDEDVIHAAVFDYLVAQPDRDRNNWLGVRGDDGILHLKLIDHAWAFRRGATTNSTFSAARSGRSISELHDDLAGAADALDRSGIRDLIGDGEFRELETRLNGLVSSQVL